MSTRINVPDPYSQNHAYKPANNSKRNQFIIGGVILAVILGALIVVTMIVTSGGGPQRGPVNLTMCRVPKCGQVGPKYVQSRIVGGRQAKVDEFPYQVALSYQGRSSVWCGGSMINDRWIMTAAHCMWDENAYNIRVSVGIMNVNEIITNSMKIEKYWMHPKYTGDKKFYDIALIKTAEPISAVSKNFVSPICLPFDESTRKGDVVIVSGFGTTEEDGDSSDILKTTKLQIVEEWECERFPSFRSNSMICAGDMAENSDTCQGDSGGSLAKRSYNGTYVIHGITSFGNGCGRRDTPGVYTDVSKYLEWTCETMVYNGLD